jgi:hypothetical protein
MDGGSSYVRFIKEHLYTTFFVANDNTTKVTWVQYINSSNETHDITMKVLVQYNIVHY